MKRLIALLSLSLALLLPCLAQAQIVNLQQGDSLTMVLSGAKTSVDATYVVSWTGAAGGPKSEVGTTNGVTAVSPVAAPTLGVKQVTNIVVNNCDTGSITLTINKKTGSTSYPLSIVSLAVGDTLSVTPSEFRVLDSSGQTKSVSSFNLLTMTLGASTAAAGSSTSDAGVLPSGTGAVYPTTAADDTKGVRISTTDKVTGRTLFIGNGVSNKILKVYAPSGGTINGGSADAAFSSVSGKGVIATCLSSSGNTWLAW